MAKYTTEQAAFLEPPSGTVEGRLQVSGSKSFTNRALILAALAKGESRLVSASASEDSQALLAALSQLGIRFEWLGSDLVIYGSGGVLRPFRGELNVGPAGTAFRFLAALGTLIPEGEIVLDGNQRMRERPVGPLVEALRACGAALEYLGREGFPPLLIRGRGVPQGGRVVIDSSVSSQFVSALLLVGSCFKSGLHLELSGAKVSESYIGMTAAALRDFGVEVVTGSNEYVLRELRVPSACRYVVEGDASGAGYFWGLAAISGGRVRVENVSSRSCQGDLGLLEFLRRMGCEVLDGVSDGTPWIQVAGPASLRAIDADLKLLPDSAQTLAVVAACAKGESLLSGLETLRIKETDRIAALAAELAKLGSSCIAGAGSLRIRGAEPRRARISTYGDHRMAMAFAMLAGRYPGIQIMDPAVVGKSFPTFWDKLRELGVTVKCG